jgi:signal transduction histidine kinase
VPRVRVDRNHLQQAFFNIIYNAAQAMTPAGGRLDIETSWHAARDRVSVRFADSGPGIPEDHLGKIFEPFFTTKDVGEGTGLGLAVVRGIVAQYGGTVRVDSAPGKGAVFTIFLPAASGGGAPARGGAGGVR